MWWNILFFPIMQFNLQLVFYHISNLILISSFSTALMMYFLEFKGFEYS